MVPRVKMVVDTITEERERFERFCRSLSPEELARPVPDSTWVVKDFISHLATIDRPIAGWFASLAGNPSVPSGDRLVFDVDRFNDAAVAKRRDRGVEEILREASRERTALIAELERFNDADLDATIRFDGDSKRAPTNILLSGYLHGWARHDAIHVADMLKALPERRDDPGITSWLQQPELATLIGYYQKAMT